MPFDEHPGQLQDRAVPGRGDFNGTVNGNTIAIDVPYSAWGANHPLAATEALYSVTAFTVGRDLSDDIYADADASHAFDLKGK